MKLKLFHWNPHWECFNNKCCTRAESCPAVVKSYLYKTLKNIDFASLLMYEQDSSDIPLNYKIIKL